MSLKCTVQPTVEPITLGELKLACGFGPMEDTDLYRGQTLAEQLRDAIVAARTDCQNILNRAIITQTWQYQLDHFPRFGDKYYAHHRLDIPLPMPSFQGLTAFTYVDYMGVTQNMLADGSWGYQIVPGGDTQPAHLRPPIGRGWPVTQWQYAGAVTITYTCGYGPTAASVPPTVRQWVKLRAKWLFEGAQTKFPDIFSLISSEQNLIA